MKPALGLVLAMLLAGCGFIDEMKGSLEKSQVAVLEKAVTEIVARVFQAQPETLLLQIASGPTAS